MDVRQHELEDVADLIEDLTLEKRRRAVWVRMFMMVTALMFATVVVCSILMMLALTSVADGLHGDWVNATNRMLPLMAMVPLFGAALASLSGWKAQADCQQSLEMAIRAAEKFSETGRSATLTRRLRMIECARKEKVRMWRELAGAILA